MRTRASATASRNVTALSVTSTIWARPWESRWVRDMATTPEQVLAILDASAHSSHEPRQVGCREAGPQLALLQTYTLRFYICVSAYSASTERGTPCRVMCTPWLKSLKRSVRYVSPELVADR